MPETTQAPRGERERLEPLTRAIAAFGAHITNSPVLSLEKVCAVFRDGPLDDHAYAAAAILAEQFDILATPESEPDFFELARRELQRAREKHPGRQRNLHEGYAVLLEEVDELWDAIKSDRAYDDPHHLLVECIQIAAMAGRMAEDRGLLAATEMPSAGGSGDLLHGLIAATRNAEPPTYAEGERVIVACGQYNGPGVVERREGSTTFLRQGEWWVWVRPWIGSSEGGYPHTNVWSYPASAVTRSAEPSFNPLTNLHGEYDVGRLIRAAVDHDPDKGRFYLTCSVGELAQRICSATRNAEPSRDPWCASCQRHHSPTCEEWRGTMGSAEPEEG